LEQNFEIGSIVTLKSGGPNMTVKSFNTPGAVWQYTCQWFSGKKLEQGVFSQDSLLPGKVDEK
jgi:uncharacterized protein YodC (DUF2158 family)